MRASFVIKWDGQFNKNDVNKVRKRIMEETVGLTVMMGALKMTDMKMTDHQNCKA